MTGRNSFAIINNDPAYTPAPDANGNFLLAPDYSVPSSFLKGAKTQLITPQAGTAGTVAITIGGTYVIGDTIRVTIESNITGKQKFVKSYVVEVTSDMLTGTPVNNIAEALVQKFKREIAAGLIDYPIATAVRAGALVTLTQSNDDTVGLIGQKWTDSAAGTVAVVNTATTISEGQPSDLVDNGIDSANITLAAYDTVKIELNVEVAQPFIDSKGVVVKELFWYGDPAGGTSRGAALVAAIAAL